MIRHPVASGRFYSDNPELLVQEVSRYLHENSRKVPAKALIAPHAGFVYSGHVAGDVYSRVKIPEHVIILGPNHTGMGIVGAVMDQGEWLMPMGPVPIDVELASEIIERAPLLSSDYTAHIQEHSIEVQLPFLQRLRPDFKMVPVCLEYLSFDECVETGEALADVIGLKSGGALIVASSDMTHYESHDSAVKLDRKALDRIEAMDPSGLYATVQELRISMCGIIPTTVAMIAAARLGATKADVVKYATSGDVSGDKTSVVGYAGVIVH